MTAESAEAARAALRAFLARHGWSVYRLAKTLGVPVQTVRDWTNGTTRPSPLVPFAVCELERRSAEREGLGVASCPACDALAVEDDAPDDRYGCVLCGRRVDPEAAGGC